MKPLKLKNQQYMPPIGILVLPPVEGGAPMDFGIPIALQEGLRSIDISEGKLNYKEVGEVLRKCMEDMNIERKDLFITVSFHNHNYLNQPIPTRIKSILTDLQLKYVDLCLLNKPLEWIHKFWSSDFCLDEKFAESRKMDEAVAELKDAVFNETVGSVGLNCFDKKMLRQMRNSYPHLQISVLKTDITPYFQEKELRQYCRQKEIQVIGFSGETQRTFKDVEPPLLLENPTIRGISTRLCKREMQIIFRWFIDSGMAVHTKAGPSKKLRLIQKVAEFNLSEDDMDAIENIDFQEYSASFNVSRQVNKQQLKIPHITMNNSDQIPMIGVSMWHKINYLDSSCHHTDSISANYKIRERMGLEGCLEAGVRHFDFGQVFENQKMFGSIFKRYYDNGRLKREDLYLATKVWNTFHSTAKCLEAVEECLSDLQTDYIDLMMIHYPQSKLEGGDLREERDGYVDYVETWKALETCVVAGKIRSIGLANFNLTQIERIIENAAVYPCLVQAECSIVYKKHLPLMEACREKNIAFAAAWPFGIESDSPTTTLNVDDNPEVIRIATALKITTRQVAMLFLLQKGIIALPRAHSFEEATSYLEALNTRLSEAQLELLTKGTRDNYPSWNDGVYDIHHKQWPWRRPK